MEHYPIFIIGAIIIIAIIHNVFFDKEKKDAGKTFEEEKDFNRGVFTDDDYSTNSERNRAYFNGDTGNDNTYNSSTDDESISSRQIAFDSLKSMGCQPKFMDDSTMIVEFQGEKFEFAFPQEQHSRYVRIWDPYWTGIEANNPNLYFIKEAINSANHCFGPTVVMSEPDENNNIALHSRYDIMLHPACPDNDQYIKNILSSFFFIKDIVRREYQDIDARQAERRANRRPIGFDTVAFQNNNTPSDSTQPNSPQQ